MIGADLIRTARLRAGISQRELARRVGRHQSAIARWESGRVAPSFETLRTLIRACGFELTYGLANADDSYVSTSTTLCGGRPRSGSTTPSTDSASSGRSSGLPVSAEPFDPKAALEVLNRHGVAYVVIGAIAAIAQGFPLDTGDLDVTPQRSRENVERLVAALVELQAKLRTPRDAVEFPVDVRMLETADARTLTTTAGDLNLVFVPAGTRGYDDLRRDAVEVTIGVPVLVASLRNVIRMKEGSNRPKDQEQLPAIRATLERVREREQP